VRPLEEERVIRSYRAVVDSAALGLGFEVLVFASLDRPTPWTPSTKQSPACADHRRPAALREPDYLIRVVSADLDAYQRLYESVPVRHPRTGITWRARRPVADVLSERLADESDADG
jgi:DNA-binding Lrp family transcriptional regulator